MNKIGEKIVLFIMTLQGIIVGSIYLYSRMEKWNLKEEMTVLLYPFYAFVLIILVIFSGLFSAGYAINKILSRKKIYYSIPTIIILFFLVISDTFFSENRLREHNFEQYKEERKEIVELILNYQLLPDENGIVDLPSSLKNEEMARGGRVYIVDYNRHKGIYFCTFSGILESSAGYVCLTNYDFDVSRNNKIILHNQYEEDWYYCGTD